MDNLKKIVVVHKGRGVSVMGRDKNTTVVCIIKILIIIHLASILPALTDDMNERTVLATWRKFLAFMGSTIVSATALTLVNLIGHGNEALGLLVLL